MSHSLESGKENACPNSNSLLLSASTVNNNGELPTKTCLEGARSDLKQACNLEKENGYIDSGQKLAQLFIEA